MAEPFPWYYELRIEKEKYVISRAASSGSCIYLSVKRRNEVEHHLSDLFARSVCARQEPVIGRSVDDTGFSSPEHGFFSISGYLLIRWKVESLVAVRRTDFSSVRNVAGKRLSFLNR